MKNKKHKLQKKIFRASKTRIRKSRRKVPAKNYLKNVVFNNYVDNLLEQAEVLLGIFKDIVGESYLEVLENRDEIMDNSICIISEKLEQDAHIHGEIYSKRAKVLWQIILDIRARLSEAGRE